MQRDAGERKPVLRRTLLAPLLAAAALIASAPARLRAEEAAPVPPSPQEVHRPAARFGALAFTADGSFASAWKFVSKDAVEARVRAECAAFNRGRCEVISLPQDLCAAIATFHRGTHKVTYPGGALAPADAQRLALQRCSKDGRAGGKCRLRTVVCGDGRR